MVGSSDELPVMSILLVDDQPANLLVLEAVLEPLGQRLVRASSGEEALSRLLAEDFAVILLDVMMPGLDGLATAALIRGRKHGRSIPIILMTAGDTPAFEGYSHGAVDFMRKPLEAGVVRAKVEVFLELFRARQLTQRHAAQMEAQEREAAARTAALLNASLDAVIGMDHDGRINEFNASAEAMFGYTRQAAMGSSLAELLIPPASREAHRRGLGSYLATGKTQVLDRRLELDALRSDGTRFPIELAIRRVATAGPASFLAYARDLTSRKQIERAQTFLAEASEVLAASLDYEATLEAVAQLAIAHIADWCVVEIAGDAPDAPSQLAIAHVDPAKVALATELRRRYPPDPSAPAGVAHVIRTGQAELYEDVPEALVEQRASDAEHLNILRALQLRSVMIVPIIVGSQAVGAISFIAAESRRRYGPTDLGVAEELARRAATAIERARLYRATQAAEQRARFLAEATEVLGSTLDYNATLERVVRLAVPVVADSAALYRLTPEKRFVLTTLAACDEQTEALMRELDALLPLALDDDRMLARVVRSGRAELLAEIPRPVHDSWTPTSRANELAQQLQFRSYMAIPLLARGRPFGALALTTLRTGRRLGGDDLALAEELARRAGLAIENAELYQQSRQANREKDEFLATVSHELRTPLTAILGWLHLLRDGSSQQVSRGLAAIERNASAQARIVDDLLDVSRIVTDQLRLQLGPVDLASVTSSAIETVRPLATAKGIQLTASIAPDLGSLLGDAERLQQVAWNLLANAVKFTDDGGQVSLVVERQGSSVALRVQDTGKGIAPEFLPQLFQRFRQADNTSTRAHRGLGLGLAIVRHLVEAHEGSVRAESAGEGKGATFTVVLPIRPLPLPDAPYAGATPAN